MLSRIRARLPAQSEVLAESRSRLDTHHHTTRRRVNPVRGLAVLPLLMLAACSDSPSVAVLGAYFPDWLFCIAGAVLAVVCVHVLFSHRGRGDLLAPAPIIYPALTVLFAVVLWTAAFN